MSIRKFSDEIWKEVDPSKDEHGKFFLDAVFDNAKEANKIYARTYYIVLILAVLYWVIISGNLQEFSFLSVKISDTKLLRWVIPSVMSFMFYQGICAFFFEVYLHRIMHSYLSAHLNTVYSRNFEYFISLPSFFNFERLMSRLKLKGHAATMVFASVLAVILLLSPAFLIVLTITNNLRSLGGIHNLEIINTTLLVVSVALLARTIVLIITFFLDET